MDELLEQFILEGRELVQQAFDDLLALERHGQDAETPDARSDADTASRIDGAFRAIHTLKGSAGLFDVAPMSAALHAAEDLMSVLRTGRQRVRANELEALLDCMGAVERWVEAIASAGRLPQDAESVSRLLVEALGQSGGGAAPGPGPAPFPGGQEEPLLTRPGPAAQTGLRYVPAADCFFLGDDPLALLRQVPSLLQVDVALREPADREKYDPFRCNLVISALSAAPAEAVRTVFRFVADQVTVWEIPSPTPLSPPEPPEDAAAPGAKDRTLRIDAGRIDALADLVGELSIAKNRLSYLASGPAGAAADFSRALAATSSEIDGLVGAMHRAVTRLRLVPLEQSLRRLPRLVREIAARLGREVRLQITGEETGADKATADALFEPLLHVLRNAVDHGVEPPGARIAAGKSPEGQITLHARLEGDQVVITVQDDGAGIDPGALRRRAVARGMIDQAAADALDDAGALDLVFRPGFSTAAIVTDVSGRGVGMDVVRTALRAMGGEVSLASQPGVGTTVRMAVPQAVAVITVIIVRVGGERFGIPIEAIIETARVKRACIAEVGAGRAFVLRDRTIPVLLLASLLGQPGGTAPPDEDARLVVVASGAGWTGIEVDGFEARMDVAVRPLRGLLAGLPGVRGSALLGDGRVLLVLDMAELAG